MPPLLCEFVNLISLIGIDNATSEAQNHFWGAEEMPFLRTRMQFVRQEVASDQIGCAWMK